MITVEAPDGVPEVRRGDDLAALLLAVATPRDGDVVVVTSKVVSKAEGRVRSGDREAAVEAETVRVVARRGPLRIVRNRLGLTLAAAGVDASNVAPGHVVLLPEDPDASARALRATVAQRAGVTVGVVVTDTAGRAWRVGQTDIAIGAAGLRVVDDHAGRTDTHGNELAVTMPALADEIAGAAELVQGKLGGRPFALVRGLDHLVLPAGDDGPGAAALVREEAGDLFGLGPREAVVRALLADDPAGFGAPVAADELARVVTEVTGAAPRVVAGDLLVASTDPRVAPLAFAHGWAPEPGHDSAVALRLRPLAT